MKYVSVTEGETRLMVSPHRPGRGPRGIGKDVFYNPAMELNRDISIAFLKAWGVGDKKVLDGMAASGARGVRIARESHAGEVVMLDLSSDAVDLIQRNIDFTDVKAQVHRDSIENHILENRYRYDYIDIDPFGTPVPFFTIPARFVSRNGVLAVTATDTAVLCGTYREKCVRRYSAVPENNWCCHEIGLRILIGYCVRETARYDRGAEPLLSYYDGHHFRTYLLIREGAKYADGSLSSLDNYRFSNFSWEPDGPTGPLWSGPLFNRDILSGLQPLGKLNQELIDTWSSECSLPPFFYDTNVLGSHTGRSPPALKKLISELEGEGHGVSRTHFSPTAFKTEADASSVLRSFDRACAGTR